VVVPDILEGLPVVIKVIALLVIIVILALAGLFLFPLYNLNLDEDDHE
jgi:hypothetical protein